MAAPIAKTSETKRTIGSGCATSIAAASVIRSLIGHSARGGNNNNRKISPATTQVGRPVRPYCFGGSEGPKGAGGAGWPLALPASPGGACNDSEAAACPGLRSPEAFAAAPHTLRGLPKAEPNLISNQPSQMTGL